MEEPHKLVAVEPIPPTTIFDKSENLTTLPNTNFDLELAMLIDNQFNTITSNMADFSQSLDELTNRLDKVESLFIWMKKQHMVEGFLLSILLYF